MKEIYNNSIVSFVCLILFRKIAEFEKDNIGYSCFSFMIKFGLKKVLKQTKKKEKKIIVRKQTNIIDYSRLIRTIQD